MEYLPDYPEEDDRSQADDLFQNQTISLQHKGTQLAYYRRSGRYEDRIINQDNNETMTLYQIPALRALIPRIGL